MLEKGLVQIYTGDGKGKTTAAFGLALRAAGQNNKVLIYQFLKPPSLDLGERFAIQLGAVRIRLEALDIEWDMKTSPHDEQMRTNTATAIKQAIEQLAQTAEKKFYDVIILDEIVFCLAEGLANIEDIKNLIERKDARVEIVMTGRGATAELIELGDLVTEMRKLKHPFDTGQASRRGIEY